MIFVKIDFQSPPLVLTQSTFETDTSDFSQKTWIQMTTYGNIVSGKSFFKEKFRFGYSVSEIFPLESNDNKSYLVQVMMWYVAEPVHRPLVNVLTRNPLSHYSDVIMGAMASQITGISFLRVEIKENIKAPRYWPLWGEFIDDRWNPHTKDQ